MKRLTAAFALACALTFASTAGSVDFGANDDTGKYAADGGAAFYAQMAGAGLKQNVITIRWQPSSPATIPDRPFLDRTVAAAAGSAIKLVFAVYPYPPSELEAGTVSPEGFASWLAELARSYPQVTTYIVGNEPNLNTFWRPQGDGTGRILAAASFAPFLAAGYDALKGVSGGITVLGVGLSPRGDNSPGAAGKTSPVRFLGALGDWYRSSNRMTPLMDGLSFHPYPNPSDFTVPFSFGYGWPNAGVQELGRIKQALVDAFAGTPQPTTRSGLRLYLDEVGWQVDTASGSGYEGSENVRVTTEANQAALYDQLVRFVVCDPDVAQLNFFGYWDERQRSGWQAALRRADGSERASHAAVAAAIAATGGTCQGLLRSWTPLTQPDGAAVTFGSTNGATVKRPTVFSFVPTAGEDVSMKAGLVPAGTPLKRIPALLRDAGSVAANRRPPSRLVAKPAAGRQVVAVSLAAAANPARIAVFTSGPFAATAPKPKAKRPAKKPGKSAAKRPAKRGKARLK